MICSYWLLLYPFYWAVLYGRDKFQGISICTPLRVCPMYKNYKAQTGEDYWPATIYKLAWLFLEPMYLPPLQWSVKKKIVYILNFWIMQSKIYFQI